MNSDFTIAGDSGCVATTAISVRSKVTATMVPSYLRDHVERTSMSRCNRPTATSKNRRSEESKEEQPAKGVPTLPSARLSSTARAVDMQPSDTLDAPRQG